MDLVFLSILLFSLLILTFLGIFIYFKSFSKKGKTDVANVERRQEIGVRRIQGGRVQRRRLHQNEPVLQNDIANDFPEVDQSGDKEKDEEYEKIGAKKRAKLEAKAEKKVQREKEEQLREERKQKEKKREEENRLREEKEAKEEKLREELLRKELEEKERKEQEEYLKLKTAFSVEEEGYDGDENDEDERNLLEEFISYIKQSKVVVLEDLACKFKLKTQACIERIQQLQNENNLTGVIDDRGKFIYLSQEDLNAVAKFIKQRGRVSITEIAENSNCLINLNPIVS